MKVVMSIKPEYVEKIFKGEKKFEYRKRIFKEEVESILVYATKPVGKIVGELFFSEILQNHPNDIWKLTADESGVEYDFFKKYFNDKEIAYAIRIEKTIIYEFPVRLEEYISSGKAPQSYCYVRKEKL